VPCEYGFCACEPQFEAQQVIVAVVQDDEYETGEQERQGVCEISAVVDGPEEHGEQHDCENRTVSRWQYVYASP
jgi:hypothetical protein